MAVSRTSLSEDEKDNFSIFADEEKDILRTATKLLPRPADRGSHAWLFLCASFLVEGVVFGTLDLGWRASLVFLPLKLTGSLHRCSWRLRCVSGVLLHA